MMIAKNQCAKFKPTAVLALGGGGARGMAHFGAIQAITESDFEIERIVGVSVGGLVGAMSALGESAQDTQQRALDFFASDEFSAQQASLFGEDQESAKFIHGLLNGSDEISNCASSDRVLGKVFRQKSLLSQHVLENVIAALVPDIDILDTEIPLSIVAVDLKSGLPIVLERGPLRRAIAASMAVPGYFPPVPWNNMLLCDLGVIDSLPTQVAKSDCGGIVIGVDVGSSVQQAEHCDTAIHALLRINEIGERIFRRLAHRHADLLIRPHVGHHRWFDFSNFDRLVAAGLIAGRKTISQYLQTIDTYQPQRNGFRRLPTEQARSPGQSASKSDHQDV